jgi:hypothetical protein
MELAGLSPPIVTVPVTFGAVKGTLHVTAVEGFDPITQLFGVVATPPVFA